jgi:VIT1/CCC1 family predicted Fe2+/Mn2+ transporter
MAAGEYVSVSSQTDAKQADLAREKAELSTMPDSDLEELTQIYVNRGLDEDLARKVAIQLTEKDALGAHARRTGHLGNSHSPSCLGRCRFCTHLSPWAP